MRTVRTARTVRTVRAVARHGNRLAGTRVRAEVTVSALRALAPVPRRVAVLSLHTSPLEQPGSGDAGGMNVYVVEVSRRLAAMGVAVDVFTRATSSDLPPIVELAPGVLVRHVAAGPFEGLAKDDLPGQLCAFLAGVLRVEAAHDPGWYDVAHSHYWLSGQVGWVAAERWGVPLVHSAHTLATVKNATLAEGDTAEPRTRLLGERQVVDAADRLIAATPEEARQLVEGYDADVERIVTVAPGVDLEVFRPGDASAARTQLGIPPEAVVLAFAGRLQRLKGPDVLLLAAAELLRSSPELRSRLVVLVVGGSSGSGLGGVGGSRSALAELRSLAVSLGLADCVRFLQPLPQPRLAEVFRAADLVVVPSHSESFGLVALEASACGTPVVATRVGGLTTAVDDGRSGLLVDGHNPVDWAAALRSALVRRPVLAAGARPHAERFSWAATAAGVLEAYVEALAERRVARSAKLGA